MAHETAQSSALLALPAELRNTIYHTVLKAEDENHEQSQNLSKRIGILQTCRQVREEASSIFFAETTFAFRVSIDGTEKLTAWLTTIGPKNASLLTSLVITIVPSQATQEFELMFKAAARARKPKQALKLWRCHIGQPSRALGRAIVSAGVRSAAVKVVDGTVGVDENVDGWKKLGYVEGICEELLHVIQTAK